MSGNSVRDLHAVSLSVRRRDRLYQTLLPLTVFPTFVWVALDRFAWGGDQSQYGRAAVRLSSALLHAPLTWPSLMLDVFPMKPNALIWIGQWFVPFGRLFGSIDRALLVSVTLLQVLTLVLLYRAIRRVATPVPGVAAVACLAVSSAPLFIALGPQYLAETVQTLSVAWFLLILTHAPQWSRAFLFVQLVAAGSFALSTKELQPLFCVGPGLVALTHALRRRTTPPPRPAFSRARLTAALFLPLMIANLAWYLRNLGPVSQHLFAGAFGSGVRMFWGKEDTYPGTIFFWLDAGASHFFLPGIAAVWLGLLTGGAVAFLRKRPRLVSHFTVSAAVAAVQLVIILLVFSLSPTRQPRYLLPALPYIAVLAAWGLQQLGHAAVTGLAAAVFSCQLIVVHSQAFGIFPIGGTAVRPLIRSRASASILQGIVDRTCRDAGPPGYLNIIAIDPSLPEMRGDWLAPDPLNYVVEKARRRPDSGVPCVYGYFGDDFFGAPVDRAWASLVSRQARYVVIVDPAVHPIPAVVFNQALTRANFPLVMNKLRTSGLFVQGPSLPQDPGILTFAEAWRTRRARCSRGSPARSSATSTGESSFGTKEF